MKLIRFEHNSKVYYGEVHDKFIYKISGDIFGDYKLTDDKVLLDDVKILSPVHPSKIVCVGLNYKKHQAEMNEEATYPKFFIKPSTCVIGYGDEIILPSSSKRVDYEAELAVVIKKTAKNIKENENINDYILGYTCLNDVTARDLQSIDGQWTRAKSFDTFAPIGPIVTDEVEPENLEIKLLLNGEVKQHSNTNNFIWNIDFLIREISNIMTLLPGDVVSTGTPSGIGPMKEGDIVEVSIEKIGVLKNYVKGRGLVD